MNGDPQKIISALRAQGRSDQYIINTLVNSPTYNMDPAEARSLVGSQGGEVDDVVQPRPTYKIASVDPRQALELPEPEGEPESDEQDTGFFQAVEDATKGIPLLGDFVDWIGDSSRYFSSAFIEGSAGSELIYAGYWYGDEEDFTEISEAIKASSEVGLSDEAKELQRKLDLLEESGESTYFKRMALRADNY